MSALSERWTAPTHSAYAVTTDRIKRLALALGPVRSVIRVIDDSNPPMTVDWATAEKDASGRARSISATDMSGGHIYINPLPVLEGTPRALDFVIGFGMHEASHAKHSRDRWRDLIKVSTYRVNGQDRKREDPRFEPMRVALYLWNLIEDPRVEHETSKEWPGYAPYFPALLDYMWPEAEKHVHENGLAYATVEDKLRLAFLACRYGDRWEGLPGSADLLPEGAWWQAWQQDYHDGTTDVGEAIERGLAHLAISPATFEELAEMAAQERRDREAGERLRQQLQRLAKEGIGDLSSCVLGDIERAVLTEIEAEAVERLIGEGLIKVNPIVIAERGAANPPFLVSKPAETIESRRAYVGEPSPIIEALRTALVFRPSLPRYDIKLQRQGILDDEELYRFGMGDDRVFSERIIETRPDVSLGFLVDLSGSMTHADKIETAQRLAQLFVYALHDQEGITVHVWGHTGDIGDAPEGEVYRLWEPGDPLSRLGLIETLPHANNYDGHAIAWCVNELESEVAPQKALIVLSDGLPSGNRYGGPPAVAHVRRVTDRARSRGIPVIQVAIDGDLRLADQTAMFGADVVPYQDDPILPRQMAKVMARYA